MKKDLENYLKELETKKVDKEKLLIKIGFYQHERLIHLIVTCLFAVVTFITLFMLIMYPNIGLLLLLIILLSLLVPYIFHYYFLENSVQKLYKFYDKK